MDPSAEPDGELTQFQGDVRKLLDMMHRGRVPVAGATLTFETATTRELVSLKVKVEDGSKMFQLVGAATLVRTADLAQLREALSAAMTSAELKCAAQGQVPASCDAELLEGANPHTVVGEVLRLLRLGIECDRIEKAGMSAGTVEDVAGGMFGADDSHHRGRSERVGPDAARRADGAPGPPEDPGRRL